MAVRIFLFAFSLMVSASAMASLPRSFHDFEYTQDSETRYGSLTFLDCPMTNAIRQRTICDSSRPLKYKLNEYYTFEAYLYVNDTEVPDFFKSGHDNKTGLTNPHCYLKVDTGHLLTEKGRNNPGGFSVEATPFCFFKENDGSKILRSGTDPFDLYFFNVNETTTGMYSWFKSFLPGSRGYSFESVGLDPRTPENPFLDMRLVSLSNLGDPGPAKGSHDNEYIETSRRSYGYFDFFDPEITNAVRQSFDRPLHLEYETNGRLFEADLHISSGLLPNFFLSSDEETTQCFLHVEAAFLLEEEGEDTPSGWSVETVPVCFITEEQGRKVTHIASEPIGVNFVNVHDITQNPYDWYHLHYTDWFKSLGIPPAPEGLFLNMHNIGE